MPAAQQQHYLARRRQQVDQRASLSMRRPRVFDSDGQRYVINKLAGVEDQRNEEFNGGAHGGEERRRNIEI
ncbi:hypothetical protein PR202_gb05565 [Eleusine coracana subsp. coracana]|uniref:Uncharacterized protein n=1 Tax=Eleusine coracana subsp. coracana TaxID=191504 RepID=A0AAV5E7B9_ELECO|nr:hypothetical protein PR202_gb05565 [Eleusine coracana subsp. coracana]